jgi:hypothetical protein
MLCSPTFAQDGSADPAPQPAVEETQPSQPPGAPPAPGEPLDPLRILLDEIDRLHDVVDALRLELAEAKLQAAGARRELDELRQFIDDHERLGRDFEQYRAVKAVSERDARRRWAEAARRQREAERSARQRAAKAERERQTAEFNRFKRYRKAGFTPLGFDVYLGNTSFYYDAVDGGAPTRIDYDFRIGHYVRAYPHAYAGREIDYSSMTISGSVLNASEDVRNIGVALAFFDENGSQVGGEIVQINNARPDVPYPFTATLDMALNRPFTSSSTYVLYADPVEMDAEPDAPRRSGPQVGSVGRVRRSGP